MTPAAYNTALWPPSDILFLRDLKRPSAQSLHKDIDRGCVSGMTYRIDVEHVYLKDRLRQLYFIQIDGWEYTIRNDSIETPVLSFTYLAGCASPDKAIDNVRLLGKPMKNGYRLADKTMRIAAYLMREITRGAVPDAQRVLAAYKFQPAHPLMPGFVQDSFAYANGLLKDRS